MGFFKSLFGDDPPADKTNQQISRPTHFGSKSEMDRALIAAVLNGDGEYVQSLIDEGADVNARKANEKGLEFTVLQWVAISEQSRPIYHTAELLIEAGADLNRRTTAGLTALHFALNRKNADIAKLLIDSGADITIRGGSGDDSPLNFAVRSDRVDLVQLLVDAGADVNKADKGGHTPLMSASGDIVRLLLDAGADVHAKDNSGETALFYAVRHKTNTTDIVSLLDSGADVNEKDNYGYTSLMTAAMDGHVDALRALLESGAQINAKTNTGLDALALAMQSGKTEAVKLLRQAAKK